MNYNHVLCALVLFSMSCTAQVSNSLQYLAQTPPSNVPVVFAPDLISLKTEYEFGSVFNKSGTEFFYGVDVDGRSEIRYTQLKNETWTLPKVILSDERYGYNDPFLSPDEQRLYFISKRALDGVGVPKDYDIWYVIRQGEDWSEPINAGTSINSDGDEYYISFTKDGTMFFATDIESRTEEDNAHHDIYYAKYDKGTFQKPIALGAAINTPAYEADVFVDPQESYVIFCAQRSGGFGRGDLYISFKDEGGQWSESINMGETINSKGHELCPFVTNDGKYFFYTSNQDIYWVSTKVINQLKGVKH